MASITLRGLNQASTYYLSTLKDIHLQERPLMMERDILMQTSSLKIAFRNIEILKEGATTAYGSDAVAGVVNFLTYKNFDGFKIKFGDQTAENNNNKETNFGLLFGTKILGLDAVFGFNQLNRSPFSASEMPRIAELAISGLGNTFIMSADDTVNDGFMQVSTSLDKLCQTQIVSKMEEF